MSSFSNSSKLTNATACLYIIARKYNKKFDIDKLQETGVKENPSLLDISETAEKIGFRTKKVSLNSGELMNGIKSHGIIALGTNNFAIVYPHFKGVIGRRKYIKYIDPKRGVTTCEKEEFIRQWISNEENTNTEKFEEKTGSVLFLEPTFKIYAGPQDRSYKLNWSKLLQYFKGSPWQIAQVLCAVVITSLLQLIFPFLMQNIVDKGIGNKDFQFITLILIAQLVLIFSQTIAEFIRDYLILYISSIISLSMLTDFWIKITRLPMAYFDRYSTGQIFQWLNDESGWEIKQIVNIVC